MTATHDYEYAALIFKVIECYFADTPNFRISILNAHLHLLDRALDLLLLHGKLRVVANDLGLYAGE